MCMHTFVIYVCICDFVSILLWVTRIHTRHYIIYIQCRNIHLYTTFDHLSFKFLSQFFCRWLIYIHASLFMYKRETNVPLCCDLTSSSAEFCLGWLTYIHTTILFTYNAQTYLCVLIWPPLLQNFVSVLLSTILECFLAHHHCRRDVIAQRLPYFQLAWSPVCVSSPVLDFLCVSMCVYMCVYIC